MTSRITGLHYPSQPQERQAWRVHHCSLLSGDWSGKSVRLDPKSGAPIETIWAATKLFFEPHSGKIKGEGLSLWQEQSFPFEIIGAFTPSFSQVELLKSHRGGAVTHLAFAIDLQNLSLTGNFANGGSCVLQRTQQQGGGAAAAPSMLMRSVSNNSQGSASAAAGGAVGPIPDPPKDLMTFLSICFPEAPAIAARLHQTLSENEIFDPESLTTFTHEEWEEIGISLGHRGRIKLQLQRFFPHLVARQGGEEGGAGPATSISPTQGMMESSGPSQQQQPNPPYHTHPSQQQQQQQQQQSYGGMHVPSASHYVSAQQQHFGGPPGAFNNNSFSPAPSDPQQQQQQQQPPLEYICPITREVMIDPVLATDGHSYDRAPIEQWFSANKTSPITGRILPSKALNPNVQLRNAIAQWKQQMQYK